MSLGKRTPKYSVIIPSYNGIRYVPTCIQSILEQECEDFELIISDDHSVDGTKDFLRTLHDKRVVLIEPRESLSMTEHWEWALSHARGEWCIFVGQDDGLQPYFFQLSDRLTQAAQEKGLRAIMSSRAYFFWEGCEYIYGDNAVTYQAKNKVSVLNARWEAFKALIGWQNYFELPQMYTTSLFHRDLLLEARQRQAGRVFLCHPQDANLAVVACSLERRYLKSYVPLGWVGSSPKSAGMAIAGNVEGARKDDQEEIDSLRRDYLKKISSSGMQYHELAGAFSLNSPALYFWQAFLQTPYLRSDRINAWILSNPFRYVLFATVLMQIKSERGEEGEKNRRLQWFGDMVNTNSCSIRGVRSLCALLSVAGFLFWPMDMLRRVAGKVWRSLDFSSVRYVRKRSDYDCVNMEASSAEITNLVRQRGWL